MSLIGHSLNVSIGLFHKASLSIKILSKEANETMFYIDESGIITNTIPHPQNVRDHYFVICFIQTEDPKRLKSVYKRTIKKIKNYFPLFFTSLANPNEPKGSELTPIMKNFFIEEFLRLTDIKIAHMVLDNRKVMGAFRRNSAQSFNYLIKLVLQNTPLTTSEKNHLILNIDNRNIAIKNNKQLEDYLATELILQNVVSNVTVNYLDSEHAYGIRVADVFSNVIYQRFRYKYLSFPHYTNERAILHNVNLHPYSFEYIYQKIKKSGRLTTPFIFPVSEIHQLKKIEMH